MSSLFNNYVIYRDHTTSVVDDWMNIEYWSNDTDRTDRSARAKLTMGQTRASELIGITL